LKILNVFNNRKTVFFLIFLPVFIWITGLIILPHLSLFMNSFETVSDSGKSFFSLSNYLTFFKNKIYWFSLLNTFLYAIIISILSSIITFPIAFYVVKVINKRYSNFLKTFLIIPLWVGELVVVYGWMIILGDHGLINQFLLSIGLINKPLNILYTKFSMIVGFLYISIVFMIVPIISTLESMDNSLIEAACDLGASKTAIFTKIVIPYSMPGIISGIIMVFMLVIGDYLVPDILGGKDALWFTELIYNDFLSTLNWNEGSAFGFLLLFFSFVAVWFLLILTGQNFKKVIK
jgi:spermidine/putrescine transport system permease protein